MSIHENPAFTGNLSSQTEGTKVEPPGTFCGHTLGVSITTAATIAAVAATAAALGAQQAIVFATGAMRFTLDNATTPTAAVGLPVVTGGSVTLNIADALVAKFFGTTLDVWFSA
jgi:hypothetical protein